MSTVLIKQDPVMVANHKDEPPDPDTDFILQDSLPLFDNRYAYGHKNNEYILATKYSLASWTPRTAR